MEIMRFTVTLQLLLRQNGLKVSNIGYFVYCTGKMDRQAFDKKIEFDINLIEHKGNDGLLTNSTDISTCIYRSVEQHDGLAGMEDVE
jgi:hypothetical protein